MTAQAPNITTKRRTALAGALVVLLAVAVYANSLGNEFVWDDTYAVVENPSIRTLENVPSFFVEPWSAGTTHERGRSKNAGYYRPLPLTTYAVDYAIWGPNPFGFHLGNVIIHALCALAVFGIARRFRLRPTVAFAAGALYAVHATHAEAVCVIAYRTSLLATGGVLLGLYLHLGAGKRPGDLRRLLAVPLAYAAGLLSKESAITLPALLIALDLTGAGPNGRPSLRAAVATYLPLVAITAGYFAIRAALLSPVPVSYFEGAGPLTVFLTMAEVFGLYVRLLFAPWPLCPFYDWSLIPPTSDPTTPEVLAGLFVGALYFAALVWTWWRHRPTCFLLAAYGIALLPYSHLASFVVVAGDRFLLLPSFAFAIGAAWGVSALARRGTAALWWTALAALVLLNVSLTVRRNTHWYSNETILHQTAADWPTSFNARYRYGELLDEAGRLPEAETEYRAALQLLPALEAPAVRLADVLARQGRVDEARALLRDRIESGAAGAGTRDALKALGGG